MSKEDNATLPLYDIKSPLDLPKMNPAGTEKYPEIKEAWDQALEAQDKLAKDLEDRYAQPNWFKIAAGFAKPQLGGFTASLGSAAEALGENVERQRAIAPTISKMRAEVAAGKIPLVQRSKQQALLEEFKKTNDINIATELYNLDPTSPAAQAVKGALEAAQSKASTQSTNVNTQVTGQKAAAENPYLVLKEDPMWKGTVAARTPEDSQNYLTKLNLAKPKDVAQNLWDAMSITQKEHTVANYGGNLVTQGMDQEQKSAYKAESANNLLNDLTYLRTLGSDKSLSPVFSAFNNGDLISQFRAFLDKNPGNVQGATEGLVAAAMQNVKNPTPEMREKVDKLVKGIARLEVNLRGTNVNPTDAFQTLNSNASPSLANSQAGFVGILDQMGLQARHDIERHNRRINSGVSNREIWNDSDFENQYRDEVERLAKSNSLDVTPRWYKGPVSTHKEEKPKETKRRFRSAKDLIDEASKP